MKRFYIPALFWGLILAFFQLPAQETSPVLGLHNHSPGFHVFRGMTLVQGPGKSVPNGMLIVRKGRISYAGPEKSVPKGAVVHNLEGKWVFPGLIDVWSDYGVPEVKAASGGWGAPPQYETESKGPVAWNQALKPEHEVAEGFSGDPEKAEKLRKLGFTTVQAVPNDGIFRGVSLVTDLSGENVHEAILNGRAGNFFSFKKGSSTQNYPRSLMGAIALIRQTFYDAKWYREAKKTFSGSNDARKPEFNQSLEAVNRAADENLPHFFEVGNWQNLLRAEKIGVEFGMSWIYKTEGDEYKRPDAIKATGASLILPLDFPEAYDVSDPYQAQNLTLEQLRHWESAPANAAIMEKKEIPFAFTLSGLKDPGKAPEAIREMRERGLSEAAALAAWTTEPAKMLGLEKTHGTLETGKMANFSITSGPLFEEKTTIYETWIQGTGYVNEGMPLFEIRGTWELSAKSQNISLLVEGEAASPSAKAIVNGDTLPGKLTVEGEQIGLVFAEKDKGAYRLKGWHEDGKLSGNGFLPDGSEFNWSGLRTKEYEEKIKPKEEKKAPEIVGRFAYPNKGFGREGVPAQKLFLIKNATIWTNSDRGVMGGADVLIQDGKVKKVGKGLSAGKAIVIDGTGMHLTPGIIDEHSHIAIMQGVNEGSHAVTAEVSIADAIDCEDIDIYRQLAGGVTTSQLLHGSANPIGGQSAIIKLRWGATPEEMKFEGAAPFIKFALGENVKQSNWGDDYTIRYPQTRLGVEQLVKDAFQAAKDYRSAKKKGNSDGLPVRKNLQLETLLQILDGKRFITCHSYVQSELNMLMKLGDEVGFKVNTFTHVLEGYKVTRQIREHGANGSTFSDWWAYKYEVIDAIPYNAALMHEAGINVCINSDDAEMGRRLNQEAAKAVKYGGMSEEDALKLVTLNPAKALHIDNRVGSIEAGKDADLVLWSDHPLSIYAKAQKTFIDGRIYFDREELPRQLESIEEERAGFMNKLLSEEGKGKKAAPGKPEKKHYHCETIESDYNHE